MKETAEEDQVLLGQRVIEAHLCVELGEQSGVWWIPSMLTAGSPDQPDEQEDNESNAECHRHEQREPTSKKVSIGVAGRRADHRRPAGPCDFYWVFQTSHRR